jgi:hypothetical protein
MRARRSPPSSRQASAYQDYRRKHPAATQQGTNDEEESCMGVSSPVRELASVDIASPQPQQGPAYGAAAHQPRTGSGSAPGGARALPAGRASKQQTSGGTGCSSSVGRHVIRCSLAMLGACLAVALILSSVLASAPVKQRQRQHTKEAHSSAVNREGPDFEQIVRQLQEHVRLHGPAEGASS